MTHFAYTLLYVVLAMANALVIGFLIFPFGMICLSFFSPKRKTNFLPTLTQATHEQTNLACIITAYQNVPIAVQAVEALLQSNYREFHIYLVADNCPADEVNALRFPLDKVTVLRPETAFHAKVKSLQYAVQHFVQPHAYCLVFDADNLADANFLATINQYILAGYQAVQGRRVAKNLNTIYACADATGEIYKNYIERYVPYLLGSSATIAGSGMAVATPLFIQFLQSAPIQNLLAHGQVIVAEDKMLQNFLANRHTIIAFANNALVYDEKVSKAAQVKRQRTRWLYAYFQNLPHSVKLTLSGIATLNVNRFIMGIFSLIPPMFILAAASCFLVVLNLLLYAWQWAAIMAAAIAIFALAIPFTLYLSQAPRIIWQSLWGLPAFAFSQFLSLLQIKQARHSFLTTQHTQEVGINEVSKNK